MALKRPGDHPFRALGCDAADELQMKMEAVHLLAERIQARGLSQAAVATAAGLSPGGVNHPLAGRLDRFSIERVNRALAVVNARVEVEY